MPRPLPPLWLGRPSRFAGIGIVRARIALSLLAALLLAALLALLALGVPEPPSASHDPARRGEDQADVVLYEAIVEGVRGGGGYYEVTAAALRQGNYPLRPFVTFRLPTLAVVQAALPRWSAGPLLYVLAAATVIAWHLRLRGAFARPPPRWIAVALLLGGLVVFVQGELVAFHEIWAGLLIALSLALRRPGRWVEAAAIGLVAMLVRETAALFVGIMAVLAWRDGHGREALGWIVALLVFAIVVVLHAHAVSLVVLPWDPASPGWNGMLGFGFFVKAMTVSTVLTLAPAWLAALLVALALFGWAAWADALAVRTLATLLGYAVLIAVAGRTDTFYWGLMVAPTLLVGLAFAPDGVRDLLAAARRGRRITVTRMAR